MFYLLFLLSAAAFANPEASSNDKIQMPSMPLFLDLARNDNGSVKYVDHTEASLHCASQGARLPTGRELALLSMSLEAKGIAEVANGKPDKSYHLFRVFDPNGVQDFFYFSNDGYQPPEGDLANHWIWSSSVSDRYSINSNALALRGQNGDFVYEQYYYKLAFRCVVDSAR